MKMYSLSRPLVLIAFLLSSSAAYADTATLLADGDVSLGTWVNNAGGTANIFNAVDEGTASPNDADFITQSAINPSNQNYVHTASNSPSNTGTVSQIDFVTRSNRTGARTCTLAVFYSTDGTTPGIQAGGTIALDGTLTTRTNTVSSLSLTKTDIDNLRVLFRANCTGTGQGSKVQVSASQCNITFTTGAARRRILLVE